MTESIFMNLSPNDIHLWYVPLDVETSLSLAFSVLSVHEQQKANQFYLASNRKKYILRHFFFREILSFYCSVEPQSIEFIYHSHQKPYLKENAYDIQFNTSHSGDMAILALNKKHPIGVDIECLKSFDEMSDIVSHFFSKKEKAYFSSVLADKKREAFYSIWTAREAFLKASGEGLSGLLPENNTVNSSLNSFRLHYKNRAYIASTVNEGQNKKIITFDYRKFFVCSSAPSANNSISSQFKSGRL